MNCPKCNSENVVMVGELAHCRACENYYKPFLGELSGESAAPRPGGSSVWAIRHRADSFAFGAVCLFVLAVVVGVISIFLALSGTTSLAGFCLAGSLAGSAFWLYHIVQVMHIRANTEK